MAKPASGTALDTNNSLYTSLKAVWGLLESSGTSSADSTGNGYTLTLDSSVTRSTDGSGDLCIVEASTPINVASVATGFTLSGTSNWSIAWRAKQTSSGLQGMVCGSDTNSAAGGFVLMRGANYLRFRGDPITNDVDFTGVTDFTADHDWVLAYDHTVPTFHLYKDGTEVSGSPVPPPGTADAAFTINNFGTGYQADTYNIVGTMTYMYVWSGRLITGVEAGTLHSTPYTIFATNSISISTPAAYKVFSQSSGSASITISGSYAGTVTNIEYNVDSGGWSTLVASPTGGTYSAAKSIATGTHTIGVRFSNNTSITATVSNILIGDNYLTAGQSNNSGRFTNNQTYTGGGQKAGKYPVGGGWSQLSDPSNIEAGGGSCWLPLATQLLNVNGSGYPAGFITTAVGGTSIGPGDWGAGGGTYSTQAENTCTSAGQAIRAVLWQQGETDAIGNMSASTYNTDLRGLAAEFNSVIAGNPILIASPLAPITPGNASAAKVDAIMQGTITSWAYTYIRPGPLMYDQVTDGLHWLTDAQAAIWAKRWWVCMHAALDSIGTGRGPKLNNSTLNAARNKITVSFNQNLKQGLTFTNSGWQVLDNGTASTISTVTYDTNSSGIILTLSNALIGSATTCSLTFGSGDKAAGAVVPLSTDYTLPDASTTQLPVEPIFGVTVSELGSTKGIGKTGSFLLLGVGG